MTNHHHICETICQKGSKDPRPDPRPCPKMKVLEKVVLIFCWYDKGMQKKGNAQPVTIPITNNQQMNATLTVLRMKGQRQILDCQYLWMPSMALTVKLFVIQILQRTSSLKTNTSQIFVLPNLKPVLQEHHLITSIIKSKLILLV